MTRLAFFGDSNSRGLEIEDHEALGISFSEVNRLKKYILQDSVDYKEAVVKWHVYMGKKLSIHPRVFVNRAVKSSYPYVLADRLNSDIIVYSQTASSMDFVLLQIQKYHALAEIIPERDTLVVGMCRPTRTFTLDKLRGEYDFSFEDSSGLMYNNESDDVWTVDRFLTDHKLLATYYSALDSLINFVTANKYRLILVHHFTPEFIKINVKNVPEIDHVIKTHCVSNFDWSLKKFCLNTYHKAQNFMFDENKHLMSFQNDRELCGLKHPDQQAHREFAEYMAENWEHMAEKLDNISFN